MNKIVKYLPWSRQSDLKCFVFLSLFFFFNEPCFRARPILGLYNAWKCHKYSILALNYHYFMAWTLCLALGIIYSFFIVCDKFPFTVSKQGLKCGTQFFLLFFIVYSKRARDLGGLVTFLMLFIILQWLK